MSESSTTSDAPSVVSVIIPFYNAAKWLPACLDSVKRQTFGGMCQVSLYNDSSTDNSMDIVQKWVEDLSRHPCLSAVVGENTTGQPKGCGFAKNRAVQQSNGLYLCFLDADDEMMPDRIRSQHNRAETAGNEPLLIGSKFIREPSDSTTRYTQWANNLTTDQLRTQIYTSHGPTVIMPTWFCRRTVFDAVGGFDESGRGTPEDLIFFYKYLHCYGQSASLCVVPDPMVMYRYHSDQTTWTVAEETIMRIRLNAFEQNVLAQWPTATIWNAGKEGRKIYRMLSGDGKAKIVAFCDVDRKKIDKGFYTYEETDILPKPKIPIVHYSEARPPFMICVKLGLTGGQFEENLRRLDLSEGIDYYHLG